MRRVPLCRVVFLVAAYRFPDGQTTNEALSQITGERQRLASNPTLARSIEHRFPYLDPLNHLQVELMRRNRLGQTADAGVERVRRGIHISINGIAAGLRNTG